MSGENRLLVTDLSLTNTTRWTGRRTNPYIGSLLDDYNHASKELVYMLFHPAPVDVQDFMKVIDCF